MKILFDRQSVCMGDDIHGHSIELTVAAGCRLSEFLQLLPERTDLPFIETCWVFRDAKGPRGRTLGFLYIEKLADGNNRGHFELCGSDFPVRDIHPSGVVAINKSHPGYAYGTPAYQAYINQLRSEALATENISEESAAANAAGKSSGRDWLDGSNFRPCYSPENGVLIGEFFLNEKEKIYAVAVLQHAQADFYVYGQLSHDEYEGIMRGNELNREDYKRLANRNSLCTELRDGKTSFTREDAYVFWIYPC